MKKVEKVQELQRNVEELKNSVVELQRRLWIYENPNIPSSKRILKEKKDDENRPEGKKGAPEGHVGATRDKPKPNRFIDLKPRVCAGCNSRNIEMTGKEKKIIEDIRIEKVVTEFTQYRYHCNDCGCDHVTTHPELPKTGIFGPTITGIWEMLHYKGHVPFECLSQISGNLFGVPITQGGMHNAIYRTAQIFEPTFEEIRQQIRESNYVRSDETLYPFNGRNWWLWNLSNHDTSLVLLRDSRGTGVLREVFDGDFSGISNTDCFSAYDCFGSESSKCWSHLLGFADKAAEEDAYGKRIREMLKEMFAYIKQVKEDHLEGTPEVMDRIDEMKDRIRRLRKNKRRSRITERLVKRLQKYIDSWFTCLVYDFVEPTNNASERDIRKNVVARNISGQHRSVVGTHCREIMMSTILTKQKNDVNVFDFIQRGIRQYNSAPVGS